MRQVHPYEILGEMTAEEKRGVVEHWAGRKYWYWVWNYAEGDVLEVQAQIRKTKASYRFYLCDPEYIKDHGNDTHEALINAFLLNLACRSKPNPPITTSTDWRDWFILPQRRHRKSRTPKHETDFQ